MGVMRYVVDKHRIAAPKIQRANGKMAWHHGPHNTVLFTVSISIVTVHYDSYQDRRGNNPYIPT